MKKALGIMALFAVLATAGTAQAAPLLYANFCPGDATCPSGVTEASLNFVDWGFTADPNDYILVVVFSGSASAPAYVDEFSFTISGAKTPEGYESVPTMLSFSSGSNWATYFDNISASNSSCTSSTFNSNEVCSQSGPGDPNNFGAVLPGQTAMFSFYVDLADGLSIDSSTAVNLRAQFLNSDGSNAGILSPDSHSTPVPEPATLLLTGLGLIGLSRMHRKR